MPRAIPNLDWSYDRTDHYLTDLGNWNPLSGSLGRGWSDATTPRTDRPVRFEVRNKHVERMHKRGTFEAVPVGYIFVPFA